MKTSHALLTNVLSQLRRQDPNTLIHFSNEPIYNIDKEKTVWTIEMLWHVFNRIVNDERTKPMLVIIDALDGPSWLTDVKRDERKKEIKK